MPYYGEAQLLSLMMVDSYSAIPNALTNALDYLDWFVFSNKPPTIPQTQPSIFSHSEFSHIPLQLEK